MPAKRTRKPSTAVAAGAPLGTAIGTVIDIGLVLAGKQLPPGTGAALGGALATLFAWLAPGGRKGEAD